MGKSTISMVIFHSYGDVYQRGRILGSTIHQPLGGSPGGRQSRSQMHVPAARVHALARAYSYGHVEPWAILGQWGAVFGDGLLSWCYPLVNVYIAMENHHV